MNRGRETSDQQKPGRGPGKHSVGGIDLRLGKAILNHISDQVYVFDALSGDVAFANAPALACVNHTARSITCTKIADFIRPAPPAPATDAATFWQGPFDTECAQLVSVERRDGSVFHATLRMVAMPDGGQMLAILAAPALNAVLPADGTALDAMRQLQIAIESLPDGFVLYDVEDRLVICNERYRTFYPESAAVMVPGARFEDILRYGLARGQYATAHGREEDWLRERLAAHAAADTCLEQELGNGTWLRVLEQKVPGGGRVGLRIDITEQVQSRERAEVAERRLLDAIEALPAGFWLFDSNGRLVLFNERYKQLFKLSEGALAPGNTYEDVLRYGLERQQYPDAIGREEDWLKEVLGSHRAGAYDLEYELADGTWIKSYNQPTSDGGQVGFRVDITRQKVQQFELQHAAFTDDLTGLRNRRDLSRMLEEISGDLAPDERLAILHIDLDKFKSINDTLGHDAGDHVLRQTAQRLVSGDMTFDVTARVGGDEFLLALRTRDDNDDIVAIGTGLIGAINVPVPYRDKLCHVGASVGVAFVTPQTVASIEETIADADIALNAAKTAGRSTCCVFTNQMRAVAVQSAQISAQIREGLASDQFKPFFQPQIDVQTRQIIGFEALARWDHPTRGVRPAIEFVHVAQDSRLIEEIDNRIFDEVCRSVSKLTAMGIRYPRISVNVSTAKVSDPKLVDRLIWSADAADIDPASLGIEILESTMLDDRSAHVIENIHRLAQEGFSIELDDFGTGHAAIANLRKFPVERIKIDRSLIAGIDHDAELQLITGAIIGMARKLGLRVLGEGIETEAEFDFLKQARCTCAQGFLFGRPMGFDALADWIANWPQGVASDAPGVILA